MLAVVSDLGKYRSMSDVELILNYLKFNKTKSGWIGDKTSIRITHMPATDRYLVQEVMPA